MRRKRAQTRPIYTFALVWLLFSLFFPLLKFTAYVVCAALALGAAVASSVMLSQTKGESAEAAPEAEEKKEDAPKYPAEVQAVLDDGKLAIGEFGRLYASIQNKTVREKINRIMELTDKIVRDAIDDPSDVPEIRKFLDFYLPTTIKLLNAYDRMDAQGIEGQNISAGKKSIEEMLDTTIHAYEKQLDSLFANQALDIDSDIRAITGMMAREGLTGESVLDWNAFMKKYNAEKQKGSVQNG